jgi:hypothetical protein
VLLAGISYEQKVPRKMGSFKHQAVTEKTFRVSLMILMATKSSSEPSGIASPWETFPRGSRPWSTSPSFRSCLFRLGKLFFQGKTGSFPKNPGKKHGKTMGL